MSASIPHSEIWWPRKSISIVNRVDFLGEQYSSASLRASGTAVTLPCSVIDKDQIIISLRYAWQILPIRSLSTRVTWHWWVAGEFQRPIDMTTHFQSPKGVRVAVYFMWSGLTSVWKKEFVISIFLQTLPWAQSARMSSIQGSG